MPEVRVIETPSKMRSAPMNVARLRVLQSIVKMSTPATNRSRPFRSSIQLLRATRSSARERVGEVRQGAWGSEHGNPPGKLCCNR
jgi:hypothetical protein